MSTSLNCPVILFTYGPERIEGYPELRSMISEHNKIKGIMDKAKSICEPREASFATLDEFFDNFRRYDNRIAIFHYAGHAEGYDLFFRDSNGEPIRVDIRKLGLDKQKGLVLVFLNACNTKKQKDWLRDHGIPAVISTHEDVDDLPAAEFAIEFYKGLSKGQSLAKAYSFAKSKIAAAESTFSWQKTFKPDIENWSLPIAAGDWLFDLPPLPELPLPPSPYHYLEPYPAAHAELFFGRGKMIREVYNFIIKKGNAPIILLYGQSGVGKSSFLNSGLRPRLEVVASTVTDLRRDQQKGLHGVLCDFLAEVEQSNQNEDCDPCKIIIFDQVEEVWTRPNPHFPNELKDFVDKLMEFFASTRSLARPQVKFILGFRKEWLANIQDQLEKQPELSFKRFFLEPLDQHDIIEVICGPINRSRLKKHYNLTISDGLPKLIADDLLDDPESPVAPTLQILLAKMWEKATEESLSSPCFNLSLYQKLKREGTTLDHFLTQQVEKLKEWSTEIVESGLVLDLLAFHTTELGTAEQRNPENLTKQYTDCRDLEAIVQKLKDLYLLADIRAEDKEKKNITRLAHDTLAPLVRKRFSESNAPGQRARRILESRTLDGKDGIPLDETDLALVENGQFGMREWTTKERKLVDKSKSEQKKHKRNRRLFLAFSIAATLSILILGGFAYIRSQQLQQESTQKLINESGLDATKALLDLDQAPSDSLQIASRTLIEMPFSRPYVPSLEFAVTQAIQHTLERKRIDVQVSSDKKLALGKGYIAVGKSDGIEFIPLPLTLPAWITEPVADSPKVQATELYSVPGQLSENVILAIAPNDDLFVYDGDSTISTWHEQKIWKQQTVKSSGSIQCRAWKPDSSAIAFCLNGEFWLWELKRDRLEKLYTIEGAFFAAEWSPDGKHLLLIPDSNTPLLYSDESHKFIQLKGHTEYVAGGKFITAQRFITWGSDDKLFIWSTTGQLIEAIPIQKQVNGISISEKKERFAVYHQEGSVDVWQIDADGSTLTQTISLLSTGSMITDAAWHDQYLATADIAGDLHLWDVEAGSLIVTLRGHAQGKRINRVMWLRDGEHLLSFSQDQSIRVWRVFDTQQKPLCQQDFKNKTLQCRTLAVASINHPLSIENADWFEEDKVIFNDQAGALYQWSPKRNVTELIVPVQYENQITLWNEDKTKSLIYAQSADQAVNGQIWHDEQGNWVKSREILYPMIDAKWNHHLLLLTDAQFKVHLINTDTAQGESVLPIALHEEIPYLAFYNDYLALGEKGQVTIWQLGITKSDPVQTLRSTEVLTTPINAAWSATGEYIVGRSLQNDTVMLWDTRNGRLLWQYQDQQQKQFDGPTPQMTPDSKYVAFTIGSDLYVLDAANGNLLKKETTLQEQIVGVTWNSNGTRLLTWAKDSTVRLWHWDGLTLTEILRLYMEGSPVQAILSRDESRLLTADEQGNLVIWKVWPNIQALVEDVKAISSN